MDAISKGNRVDYAAVLFALHSALDMPLDLSQMSVARRGTEAAVAAATAFAPYFARFMSKKDLNDQIKRKGPQPLLRDSDENADVLKSLENKTHRVVFDFDNQFHVVPVNRTQEFLKTLARKGFARFRRKRG